MLAVGRLVEEEKQNNKTKPQTRKENLFEFCRCSHRLFLTTKLIGLPLSVSVKSSQKRALSEQ